MYATLERIEPLAPQITSFWFRPEKPLDYIAGQFTELYLPHPHADQRGEKRWFTISSSPTEELFSITTKFAPTSSSFKKTLRALPLGSRLHFAEPMGDFVLPKDRRIPLLFVAAGIGITPVRSMIKYLHDSTEQREVAILYTVHRQSEQVFIEELQAYTSAVTTLVSREKTWADTGRLSTERVFEAATAMAEPLIYLSGPETMVEVMNAELQQHGIPGRRLIVDFFHGYQTV